MSIYAPTFKYFLRIQATNGARQWAPVSRAYAKQLMLGTCTKSLKRGAGGVRTIATFNANQIQIRP